MLDPEYAASIIQDIGDALGDAAEAVGGAAATVAAGFLGGLFDSPFGMAILLIGGGLLLFTLLGKKKDEPGTYVLPDSGGS
jgi:hypothetical protein